MEGEVVLMGLDWDRGRELADIIAVAFHYSSAYFYIRYVILHIIAHAVLLHASSYHIPLPSTQNLRFHTIPYSASEKKTPLRPRFRCVWKGNAPRGIDLGPA